MKAENKFKGLIVLIIIFLSLMIGLSQLYVPKVKTSNQPNSGFSVERAMNDLEYISKEKHPVGSAWHTNVEKYITDEIVKMNLKYEIQKAKVNDKEIENILVKVEGAQEKNNTILFLCHYDTAKDTYGAGNNGLGTVTMLETMRNIISEKGIKNNLIFLFTDGEEQGLLGSKLFASDHPWSKDVDIAFNIEGFDEGPIVLLDTSKNNLWLVNELNKSTPYHVGYSLIADMFSLSFKTQMINSVKGGASSGTKTANIRFGTDLKNLKDKDIQGITFSPVKNYYNYSTQADCYANVSARTLNNYGNICMDLIKYFGNISINKNSSQNATFFNIFRNIMIVYSSNFVLPLELFITVVFIVLLWSSIKKRQISLKGMTVSIIFTVVMFILVVIGSKYVSSIIIKRIFNIAYDKSDSAKIMAGFNKYYLWSLIFMVTSLIGFICGKLMKKINFYDLIHGISLLLLLTSIGMSLFYKNGSYIIAWPLLSSFIGIGYILWHGKEELNIYEFSITSVFMIMPGIILISPLFGLYFDEAMTLGLVPALIAILFSYLLLVIPYIGESFKDKISEFSSVLGICSILIFVAGILTNLV